VGIERRSTTIDGVIYEVTQPGATAAARVLMRVMEITAKPVALLGSAALSADPSAVLGEAAEAFVKAMKPGDLEAVIKPLLESLTADGVYVGTKLFDDHFAGRIGRLVRVIKWALQENYSDFFDEFVSSIKELMTTAR